MRTYTKISIISHHHLIICEVASSARIIHYSYRIIHGLQYKYDIPVCSSSPVMNSKVYQNYDNGNVRRFERDQGIGIPCLLPLLV